MAAPLDCIECPCLPDICNSLLVDQLWCAYMCEATKRMSLISSALLLKQCLICLARLSWVICEMGGKRPYSCCFVGCCFQDLLRTARSIFVLFPFSFFSKCFCRVHVVQPYSSTYTAFTWKNSRFLLLVTRFQRTKKQTISRRNYHRYRQRKWSITSRKLTKSLQHKLEQSSRDVSLNINSDKRNGKP